MYDKISSPLTEIPVGKSEIWSVYHLSTKTENSGWKLKWYSSFHRKVAGKDGNPQRYSSFPVPTEMTGKILYHLKTPTRPGALRPLFPPFDAADAVVICFLLAVRVSGLAKRQHRENPVPLRAFHSNRIFRANGKRPWATEPARPLI